MTREEAIQWLKAISFVSDHHITEALDMAIEALQREDRFLKSMETNEPLYTEVVRCKDCIHQEHCHETVAHTRHHADFIEYWSETIEWCSRGERKGGEEK